MWCSALQPVAPDGLFLAMPGRASLPGPDLIGGLGQRFGPLADRLATLAAAFHDLGMGCKDPMHAADRTQTDACIAQGGMDPGRGPVGKAGGPQMSKHLIPLTFRQGAR